MMTASDAMMGALGGVLIGTASALLLWTNGRILGISGILSGAVMQRGAERRWRIALLCGLLLGGSALAWTAYPAYSPTLMRPMGLLVAAGLLVGFGTRLSGGCTSGHGVCGVARFSVRSLVATAVFMGTGIMTVFVMRHIMGV